MILIIDTHNSGPDTIWTAIDRDRIATADDATAAKNGRDVISRTVYSVEPGVARDLYAIEHGEVTQISLDDREDCLERGALIVFAASEDEAYALARAYDRNLVDYTNVSLARWAGQTIAAVAL